MAGQTLSAVAQKAVEVATSASPDEVPAAHFERHLRLTRPEVIETLKELEAAGYGKLIYGRHGYETRFAKGGERLEPAEMQLKNQAEHVLILRRDPRVVVRLPVDFTRLEANKIVKWVEAIVDD